jgi:hypothetical protein
VTIKQIAESEAKRLAPSSETPTLPVRDFSANGHTGAYFDAVDRAPKAGEFKYQRQFMLEQEGYLISGTILSNAGHEAINAKGLQVMQSLHIVQTSAK